MGQVVPDAVLDAAFDEIADNGDELNVCSAEPANYTEAHATYMLAQHAMTEGKGNGDYTVGDGTPSGRRLTTTQQADITITNTGTATHIVLVDTVALTIKQITTCTSQALTSGNTVTVPSYYHQITDPS